MSETPNNDIKQKSAPFLSIKWKAAVTFLLVVFTLLALLSWHFYEEFKRDYSALLDSLHLQQLEQVEKSVYQSANQLFYVINTIILSNHTQNKIDLKDYQQRVENILPSLQSIWNLEEVIMSNGDGEIFYQHQASNVSKSIQNTQLADWLSTQTQANTLSSLPGVNIICETSCRQIILVPLMDGNTRVATVAVSREMDQIQQQYYNESQANFFVLTSLQNSNTYPSNSEGVTTLWQGQLLALSNDTSDSQNALNAISFATNLFASSELLGASKAFTFEEKQFSISLLPVRGYENLSIQFLLLKDISQNHQALLQNLIQEVIVVACLFAIFTLYIFFLNWRYLSRVKQQIEVLPMLGQNQFEEVRDIVSKNKNNTFFKDELNILDDSVSNLSYQLESLENAVSVRTREMERLSLFDTLTGLANRNLLQYELQSDVQRYEQEGGILAIVLLDLDKFKRINDSIGHQQGDTLLGKVASRLKNATKSLGLAARLGGDEFAIVLRSAKTSQQVETACQKILELINRPIEIDDHSIAISCSLGVSLAAKDFTSDDMIKNAEIAMYKAKETGGNAYRLFDTRMATEAHANLSLEAEIRRAFDNKEFSLYLQPKVNMDAHIEGFESLIRWDHPDRGLVPPGEFIPAMENMGLISRLDNFVLDASCRQLQVLQNHYPDISIAVNISSTHFTDKNFLVYLKTCLDKYPIKPSSLELEITETLLMENMSVGLEIIEQIKAMGVRIAIDDFGTGYSSLSYLRKLPVDAIKIDREFIRDIPESESDMQISSVIIFLAKQLDFTVVAEGVETSEQLVFLKANQCDLAQGYYFSKPIPAHKAMLILESQLGGKKLNFG